MRFERIRLDAWGHYPRGTTLSFPAGGADFHVLRGDNEAGKSTLLDAFGSLLFGVDGDQRAFVHGLAGLSLGGEGRLADGRPIAWTRRGGRKGALAVQLDGAAVEPPSLGLLLGGLDRARWRALFGFSDRDLSLGAEALLSVPLSAVLVGERDPRKVVAALEKEAAELYLRRGKKEANRLAAEVDGSEKAAGEASTLPRSFVELEQAESRAAAARDEAAAAVERARRSLSRAESRAKVWPRLRDLEQLRARRRALRPPPGLGPGALGVFQVLVAQREKLRARLGTSEERLGELLRERKELLVREDVLAAATVIERLVGEGQRLEQTRPRAAQDAADVRRDAALVTSALEELLPGADRADLEALPLDAGQRSAAEALVQEARVLEGRVKTAEEAGRNLALERARLDRELDSLPAPVDVERLVGALARERELVALRPERVQLAARVAELRVREAELHRGLPAAIVDGTAEGLPTEAEVDAAERQLAGLSAAFVTARAALARAQVEADERATALAEATAGRDLPSTEALGAARAERDRAWEEVRRSWLGQEERGALEKAGLGTRLEERIRGVDRLADELLSRAGELARVQELRHRRAQADAEVRRHEGLAVEAEEVLRGAEEAWAERCRGSGLPMRKEGFGVLRAALRAHQELVVLREARARAEARLGEIVAELAGIEAAVRAEDPAGAEDSVDVAIARLSSRLRAAEQAVEARARLSARLAELEARQATHVGEMARLDEDRQGGEARWAATRSRLRIPPGLAVAELTVWWERVRGLRDRWRVLDERTRAVDLRSREVARWEAEVRAELSRLAGRSVEAAASVIVEAADVLLREARKAAVRAETLDRRIPEVEAERDVAAQELAGVEAAVRADLERTGAVDEASFLHLAEQAAEASRLDAELANVEAGVADYREGASAEAFEAELLEIGEAALGRHLEDARAELARAREAQDAAVRAHRDAERARLAVDGRAAAAEARQRAEESRGRLRETVEGWLVRRLARRVLEGAVRRFEEEREPAIVARTGELFRRLTRDRYGEVRVEGAFHTLRAVRSDGLVLGPEQLSEGTRQQLYLAGRLAWAERHAVEEEPMPLVLDDVLSAFDDRRATAALEVLGETATRTQVILLTHHHRVVELARGALPGCVAADLGVG